MHVVFQNALITMLSAIVSAMSDPLRNVAIEGAYKFYAYAKTTENDYDDILAKLLLSVFGLDEPQE